MQIDYIDETHQYMIDGILVPSVSALVAYATGNIYKDVPEWVLDKARIYGTAVHDAIELFESTGEVTFEYEKEIEKYIGLKEKYLLKVKDMEQIVAYKNHFCGRYDIQDVEGNIWDIKTTSSYHKENLEWQIGLYYLGMGKERDKGFCLHIPKKGKAKVHLVTPKTNKECEELIEAYEQAHKSTTDTAQG